MMKIKLVIPAAIISLLSCNNLFAQNILSTNLGAAVGGNITFTSNTGAFTSDDGNLKIASITITMYSLQDCSGSGESYDITNPWQTSYALNTLNTIPAILHITDSGLTAVGNHLSGNDPGTYRCVQVAYTLTTQNGTAISATPTDPTECQDLTYNTTTHLYNTTCSQFTGNEFTLSKPAFHF